ncbi:hypothetical protein Tco_0868791 [Tanacetum coccineum]
MCPQGREHRKQEIEYEKSRKLLYQVIDTPYSIDLNTLYGSSEGQYVVSDVRPEQSNGYSQKDKNKVKTGQNQARDWKEREKPNPKAYES